MLFHGTVLYTACLHSFLATPQGGWNRKGRRLPGHRVLKVRLPVSEKVLGESVFADIVAEAKAAGVDVRRLFFTLLSFMLHILYTL